MSDMPDSHGSDGRFVKGHRGGPGRPRRVVTAAANALDERVAEAAPKLFDMAFRQADEGNTTALKMLLDRVWPVGRSRPLAAPMPDDATIADTLSVSTTVANSVLAGEASVREGEAVGRLLEAHRKMVVRHDETQIVAGVLQRCAENEDEDEPEK